MDPKLQCAIEGCMEMHHHFCHWDLGCGYKGGCGHHVCTGHRFRPYWEHHRHNNHHAVYINACTNCGHRMEEDVRGKRKVMCLVNLIFWIIFFCMSSKT